MNSDGGGNGRWWQRPGRPRADDPERAPAVLIIVENLPVPFDTRVWNEARTLAAAGWQVSVICPRGRGYIKRHEVVDGIAIYRHPAPQAAGKLGYLLEYGTALWWEFVLAWWVRWRRGFDVIHGCNPPDLIFLVAGVFKLLHGTAYVFDHHDVSPEFYVAKFGREGFFHRLLLRFERWTFATADIVIATNDSHRRVAIERGGVAEDKVFIVRSGPTPARMRIVPPQPALKHGRAHLVAYLGLISEQEGIDLLLQAIEHIVRVDGREDVQFGIVGGGPSLETMRTLCRTMDLDAYVTFTGRLPDDEMLAMLNTADLCVNPDRVNAYTTKCTMNKVLEYMALGKPMVQFETVEGKVSAGEAAAYARPNDPIDLARQIVALLDDPERRRTMGETGYRRINDALGWEHQASRLLAAHRAALAAAGGRVAAPAVPVGDRQRG